MRVPMSGIIQTTHTTPRPTRTVHVARGPREPVPGRLVVLIERPPRRGGHGPHRHVRPALDRIRVSARDARDGRRASPPEHRVNLRDAVPVSAQQPTGDGYRVDEGVSGERL